MSRPRARTASPGTTNRAPTGPARTQDDPLTGVEERLRRSAAQSTTGDADLRGILSFIAGRRRLRLGLAATGIASVSTGGVPTGSSPSDEPGRVLAVDDVGPTVRILDLGRPAGLVFRAGQNVRVGLPGNRRAKFSIASAPHEPRIELCIQLIADGRLTPVLFALRPGDAVDVADAANGQFTLRTGRATHLMVATGTGIAPFRSMMRDAWHRRTGDRFIVLHGASYLDELPYRQELATSPGVEYRPTISRPTHERNRGWTGGTGRVDEVALAVASTLDARSTQVYACGNRGMVDAVSRSLSALGFQVAREIYD